MKVIVVGSEGVGKTSFVQRLVKGTCPKEYNRTLGAVFSEKTVAINEHDEQCTLMIWDIAGSAEFDEMTAKYYKGAAAAIIMYSLKDERSFDDVPMWLRKVDDLCGRKTPVVLVQNMSEVIDTSEARLKRREVEEMADRLRLKLYKSSVVEKVNIRERKCVQFEFALPYLNFM